MPSEPLTRVIIPFRDRGIDPLRAANLACVLEYWEQFESPIVVSDNRLGGQQFNRSAAYNLGVCRARSPMSATPDVYVFAESDMIIGPLQIAEAARQAMEKPGLVVPFDEYCYLTPEASVYVREGGDPETARCEWTMKNGRAIGAINVVSHETMKLLGQWDESFEGNWYDDDAMQIALNLLSGNPVRFVEGRAYHLHHLPGWKGDHLSAEDRAATARNKARLQAYKQAAATDDLTLLRKLLYEGTARD